jgi:hypothetical protein
LSGKSKQAVFEHVENVATRTQAIAVRGIQRGPASGRFRTSGPRAGSRASAIGEWPMSNYGHLAGSVAVEGPSDRNNPIARVGTHFRYGAYLELKPGPRGGRPWLSRAISQAATELKGDLKDKME